MVKYRPEVHCPHIGPTGGDMCIARDYVQLTEDMPFNSTLLSYNASYNALDLKNVPDHNQNELVAIETEIVYMTTVAFVSHFFQSRTSCWPNDLYLRAVSVLRVMRALHAPVVCHGKSY